LKCVHPRLTRVPISIACYFVLTPVSIRVLFFSVLSRYILVIIWKRKSSGCCVWYPSGRLLGGVVMRLQASGRLSFGDELVDGGLHTPEADSVLELSAIPFAA